MPVDDRLLFRLARSHVVRRLERGDELEDIERELSGIRGLDEGHRDALWLYAWVLSGRSRPASRLARPVDAGAAPARTPPGGRAAASALSRAAVLAATAFVPPWPP